MPYFQYEVKIHMSYKKIVVITMMWLLVLSGGVIARNSEGVPFEMHFDSDCAETYPFQKQMQDTYQKLMMGIQKDSRYTVLVHNLSLFESEDVTAQMKMGTLVLTQGDGKGATVEGTLAQWNYCVAEVEPKSWLASLFS